MSKWQEYRDEAVDFAAPYVKQAGSYVENAAGRMGRSYRRNKRKMTRSMRLIRFKQALEIVSNLVMLAAALVAVAAVVSRYWKDSRD